jgi:hypothetical protein
MNVLSFMLKVHVEIIQPYLLCFGSEDVPGCLLGEYLEAWLDRPFWD